MVRGKTGVVSQPKPNKPEVQLGMDLQKPPVTRKPATTAESLELLRSLEEHRKKLEEVQRQVLAQYGAPKPVKKKAKRKGKGFHRDRRRGT